MLTVCAASPTVDAAVKGEATRGWQSGCVALPFQKASVDQDPADTSRRFGAEARRSGNSGAWASASTAATAASSPTQANAGTVPFPRSPALRIARHAIMVVIVPSVKSQHFPLPPPSTGPGSVTEARRRPTTATAPAIASASHMAAVPEAWNPEP